MFVQIGHKLSDKNNLWLHNLSNDIKEGEVIENLILEYQKHNAEKLYSSIMNVITNANAEKFKEVSTSMCEALERIFLEVHGERFEREKQEAIDAAVEEAVEKAVEEAVEKAVEEAVEKAVEEAVAEKDAYIKELEEKLALQNQ